MQQIRKLVSSLSPRQRVTIVAAAALVAAAVWGFASWRRESGFRPLSTGLAAEDAGEVVARLRQANVPYRLGDNGATVLVPADRLAELRLDLAVQGLPKTGRLGFEIFDQTRFGLTEFAEHVNFRRALEGELERSLGYLAEVEQARVHLTFPKDSVFLESRQPAKASIMLRLRPGARLAPQNVQAVCQLAASAVEGLAPEAVSVLDTRGNLLNRPRRAGADELETSEAAIDYRRQIERDLLEKIRATLDPLLGPDRFQAGVTVDCDLASGELSEESYDPARTVMLTSQKSEDSIPGSTAAGVPGTASNLPRATAPAAGRTALLRRTENVTFQASRVVRRTRQPQGALKRVSVALLLDQEARWEGAPPKLRRVLAPPPPEKLKAIRDLVAGVINFDAARGDQIVVESLPFESTLHAAPPAAEPPPASPAPGRLDPRLPALGAAAAAILLALAAAGWLLGRRRRKQTAPAPETPGALEAGGEAAPAAGLPGRMERRLTERDAELARLEAEALQSLNVPVATRKTEVLGRHLRESIAKDAASPALVLRGWIRK